jgi:hypothetical protein
VLDVAILLPFGLGPYATNIIQSRLAQVEQMALRIMRAERCKGPVGWPFDKTDGGIVFFIAAEHEIHVVHLDAKVIDAGGVARPPAQKRDTDVAIAGDDRCVVGLGDSFGR